MRNGIINMSEEIQDFIDTLGSKDHAAAKTQFDDIMLDKLGDAMDAEKIRIANSIYNTDDEDQLELDLDQEELETEE